MSRTKWRELIFGIQKTILSSLTWYLLSLKWILPFITALARSTVSCLNYLGRVFFVSFFPAVVFSALVVVGLCDHNLMMRCKEVYGEKNVFHRHVLEIFLWVNVLGVTDHSFDGGIQVVAQTGSVWWLVECVQSAVLTRILPPLRKFFIGSIGKCFQYSWFECCVGSIHTWGFTWI